MTSVAVVPGPPAVTVNVKGWLGPAPSPVTTAVPFNTAAPCDTSTEVTFPVTYIALTSNSPLSGAPDAVVGASARHSKAPTCPLAWKASTVVTGMYAGAPVPPSMIVLPPPNTWWTPPVSSPAATRGAAEPIRAAANSAAPAQSQNLRNPALLTGLGRSETRRLPNMSFPSYPLRLA